MRNCPQKSLIYLSFILMLFSLSCKKNSIKNSHQFQITFETNGGSKVEPFVFKEEHIGEIPIPKAPEKNVWTFENWYVDENFTSPFDFKKPIKASITLYAKWIPSFKLVSTIAGNTSDLMANLGASTGYKDGIGSEVHFWGIGGITADGKGGLWINENLSRRIRKMDPNGRVTTIAGDGRKLYKDGNGISASFNAPGSASVVDSKGNLFVFDEFRLRKITPQGEVTTLAGNSQPTVKDGKGIEAGFWIPGGMVFDANNNLIVTEIMTSSIRMVTPDGTVTTLCKTNDLSPYKDGPLASAGFKFPTGICIDTKGNLYIADSMNHRIRKIRDGVVTTVAGSGIEGHLDAKGVRAQFSQPDRIAVDKFGNLYVTERLFASSRLRMISPEGDVSTIIGMQRGFKDGPIAEAKFDYIGDIAFDNEMNLYVMDYYNSLIRKLSR